MTQQFIVYSALNRMIDTKFDTWHDANALAEKLCAEGDYKLPYWVEAVSEYDYKTAVVEQAAAVVEQAVVKPQPTRTFEYFCDPGHGWIRVTRKQLIKLGILDKISSYSYQRLDAVYLEEDMDVATFYEAMDRKGITIKLITTHTNKSSKIRSYNSFKV